MIEPTALLRTSMLTLRELSGAGCVSLFVPASGTEPSATLLHEGDLAPAPELESLEAAANLLHDRGDGRRPQQPSTPVELESSDHDCLLFGFPPVSWLALRFPPGGRPADPPTFWKPLLDLALHLAAHAAHVSSILKDPITGLPDRQEFQSLLALEIDRARMAGQPLALLLVNPDDFAAVNETHGHETGDRAVREIADRLRSTGRQRFLVSRYGGATFTAILPGLPAREAERVAAGLLTRLSSPALLEGTVELEFSIGLAMLEPDDDRIAHPSDLVRRADQALSAAKRRGGNTIVTWDARTGTGQAESFDRMAGIFTGNVTKDYRNMMLLWDTIKVVAANETLDQLAEQTVRRLFEVLRPDGIGLFTPGDDGELDLLRGLTRSAGRPGVLSRLETLAIDPSRKALIRQALAEGLPCEALLPLTATEDSPGGSSEPTQHCHAVPLMAGGEPLGALFIEWRTGPMRLDASDLVFLSGLGLQIAMAWDRARLSELEAKRQEHEKRQLRAELKELRQAVRQARLVYRSPQMEQLMGTVRRVANADATILVTGPSGTGKELLAHTIHELSDRRGKPLVIVDCGAIPTTLIESELFGHERGAYTGAQNRRPGRLVEADGGTVLLDEIGELPLEVQSKLLRFVQEKQFTSVGGTGRREVDVRILAATNRDLAVEAAAGRFREDLYYRLNVVHLAVPPLRERTGDIMFLARHFLEIYSVQYQKNLQGISTEAGQCLLEYDWPGNVRELQNRFMQAVLLCEGPMITPHDLGFGSSSALSMPAPLSMPGSHSMTGPHSMMGSHSMTGSHSIKGAQPMPASQSMPGHIEADGEAASFVSTGLSDESAPPHSEGRGPALDHSEAARSASAQRLESDLDHALADLVAVAGAARTSEVPAIGDWMRDELLLTANQVAGGVADRGAAVLGMAPTTYRRRLQKAQARFNQATTRRPRQWTRVQELIRQLVALAEGVPNLPENCDRALLSAIASHYPGSTQLGCALFGVTPPTFRRRLAELEPAHVGLSG